VFKRAEPLLRWGSATRANAVSPESATDAVPVLTEVLAAGDPAKAREPSRAGQADTGAGGAAHGSPGLFEPVLQPAMPGLTLDSAGEFAERLRGQFNDYLRKDGRDLIELRCRKMLEAHASQMVEQIAGEVTLMLEIQIRQWVYEAVVEALERQNGDAPAANKTPR
jgi:Protein of unknown function (DUF2486)